MGGEWSLWKREISKVKLKQEEIEEEKIETSVIQGIGEGLKKNGV